MTNDLICVTCAKSFPFYQSKGRPVPRFCSHDCRGHTGFRPGGQLFISEMTEEQKFERLKKSFEKHVIRKEGCWGWNGSIARGGYPVMSCRPSIGPDRGHRASWVIHKGKIPEGLFVCHHCDNPICTNPDHLWLGTQKQNNDDKISKCRQSKIPPPHKRGKENGASKLSDEQVIEIKKLLKEGKSTYLIGPIFGVSKTTILRIKKGTHWKHVVIP